MTRLSQRLADGSRGLPEPRIGYLPGTILAKVQKPHVEGGGSRWTSILRGIMSRTGDCLVST